MLILYKINTYTNEIQNKLNKKRYLSYNPSMMIIQHLNKQLSVCQEQINLLKTKNDTDKAQLSRWFIIY